MSFCLDTSAFIGGWHRHYAPDVFPWIWETLDEWGREGRLLAPEEVFKEIQKQQDDLYEWVKTRHYLFRPIDESVQIELTNVLASYKRLTDTWKCRDPADPWVIAQARVSSATVVTEEKLRGRRKSPSIPDVCNELGIPCIRLLDLIRGMKHTS
jgi:hypothetical protein